MNKMNKLARPLITFMGIAVFLLNYCLIPIILRLLGKNSDPFVIPNEVIIGYWSFVSIYSAGRSFEKIKEIGKE